MTLSAIFREAAERADHWTPVTCIAMAKCDSEIWCGALDLWRSFTEGNIVTAGNEAVLALLLLAEVVDA